MPSRIHNVSKGTVVAQHLRVASTFWARLVGLLASKELPAGHGLLLQPASSIHTFFMGFAIDAVFLDKEARVIKVVPRLSPLRLALGGRGARMVLELPVGAIEASRAACGDQFVLLDDAYP